MPNVGVLSVAEDIAERPMWTVDTESLAGVKSFAALRTTGMRVLLV